MDQAEYDELLEKGRGNGDSLEEMPPAVEEFDPEEFDFTPEKEPAEDKVEVLTGEIIATPENPLPRKKANKSRYVSTVNREVVPHPTREGCTCFYYPDTDFYRSDGSDGGQPGWIIKSPMHPGFKHQIYKTSEDGHNALQQNRDKKKAAMEKGVREAVAEHGKDALKGVPISDLDAIEYTTKLLTEEIILNKKAPARERWQFLVKLWEVNGVIDPVDVHGTKIAIQVNVDPSIGQTFK